MDFRKWASALGIEGNYAKDQINYSRSYYFNFLPFHHMGFRAAYDVNERFSVAYWLVNGAGQTEHFNGFQVAEFPSGPEAECIAHVDEQLLHGQEQRDVVAVLNPGFPIRIFSHSAPAHATGGAAHIRYQFTPKFAVGARAEYLSDRGGLFGGERRH